VKASVTLSNSQDLSHLKPHTNAWFEALLKINEAQALMTATKIAETGCSDGCTICGEKTAPIFKADAPPHMLLRLCKDCRSIQKKLYDATYTLYEDSPSV